MKITGKRIQTTIAYLTKWKANGKKFTEKKDRVNVLSTKLSKTSSANNYTPTSQKLKDTAEKVNFNFTSDNTEQSSKKHSIYLRV